MCANTSDNATESPITEAMRVLVAESRDDFSTGCIKIIFTTLLVNENFMNVLNKHSQTGDEGSPTYRVGE
jgi:hypothetical protein